MFGNKKNIKSRLSREFGSNPTGGYSYYDASDRLEDVSRMYKNGAVGEVDDITWEDLEMDKVFSRINHCESFIGEQYLYKILHNPSQNKVPEEMINEFSANKELRIETQMKLRALCKNRERYYLYELLHEGEDMIIGNCWMIHLLQILLIVFLLISILSQNSFFIAGLLCIAVINLSVYLITKTKYEIFIQTLLSVKLVYDLANKLSKDKVICKFISDRERQALDTLKSISRLLFGISIRKNAAIACDINALMLDYIHGIFLYDISIYNHVIKSIANKEDYVIAILNMLGRIDTAIAVASYRKSVDMYCIPEISEKDFCFEKVTHPLIENPVSNDFKLEQKIVITGPNAAGKSTFMKSLAINCILGYSINTCLASNAKLPRLKVMTCMSLRDDVVTGESYYFREASYLRRIIVEADKNQPLLIVIDEILKGTNTAERLAASEAIMEYLKSKDVYILIATHDKQLAEVPGYEQFYFDSKIENGMITFDYLIKNGICCSKNAISLLEYLKYPTEIIETARSSIHENKRSI